jgi:hypothetical protein
MAEDFACEMRADPEYRAEIRREARRRRKKEWWSRFAQPELGASDRRRAGAESRIVAAARDLHRRKRRADAHHPSHSHWQEGSFAHLQPVTALQEHWPSVHTALCPFVHEALQPAAQHVPPAI